MAWATPQFSKTEVNKAGVDLLDVNFDNYENSGGGSV
jgi:hypothetical protein